VTAIEVAFPIGHNPQRTHGDFVAEVKRYEEHLGQDYLGIGNPVIDPLWMSQEHGTAVVERNAARAKTARRCYPFKRGELAPQMAPAEYRWRRALFGETEPRRSAPGYFQSEIDEPRKNLFRSLGHPHRQVLQRQLLAKVISLWRRASVKFLGNGYIRNGKWR
jgi:hypothetical protein